MRKMYPSISPSGGKSAVKSSNAISGSTIWSLFQRNSTEKDFVAQSGGMGVGIGVGVGLGVAGTGVGVRGIGVGVGSVTGRGVDWGREDAVGGGVITIAGVVDG